MPRTITIGALWPKLARLGVKPDMEARAAKRIILSNKMALSIGALALAGFTIYSCLRYPGMLGVMILGVAGYTTVLVLSARGRTRFSRLFHITFTNIFVAGLCIAFGKESGFYCHFLSPILVSLLIFGKEEKKSLLFSFAITALCLCVLGVTPLLGLERHPLAGAQLNLVFFLNLIASLFMNAMRIHNFYLDTEETERALATAVDAARAADGAKSRFLAKMSHEIRTPLSGILGLSELLMKSVKGEQVESVESIRSSAHDLLDIINEILDLSKIEAGMMSLETLPFELRKLVESARRLFAPLAVKKHLKFEVDVEAGTADRLLGDPVRLKQVLNNLLANAFKFTEEGGVTLRVKPLRAATAEAAILVFEVEDTGIGIADNAKEKLFKAFSQADSDTAFHFGGTGLGLYISQQIVEMMSGRIDFLSEPGKGSCFRFAAAFAVDRRDPKVLEDPAEAARRRPKPEEDPAPNLRVLIVEDHPINQKVLEGMLSMLGLKADRASDGVEALRACAQKSYDLVLMDSHMPGMDGFECTRKLRERPDSARPVIVGVTADAMTGSRERCLEAGMDEMITKPVMERDLVRVLSRWKKEKGPEAPHWTASPQSAPSKGALEANDWIDFAQMDEMNAWILQYKPGFWDKARGQFEDSYRRQTLAMREACAAGRFQEAGEAAHAFKGVCLMLGFRRMGEICGSLEAMGLGGDTLGWRELMAELEMAREPSLKAWNGRVKK